MEYQVPQFIDIESKIVGPLTLKQFIYVAGGAGLCLVLFKFLPFIFAVLLSIPVAGFAGALAFYKINNKPFINMVESAVKFYASPHLFLWHKKDIQKHKIVKEVIIDKSITPNKHLTRDRLHKLAQSLDIKDTQTDNNHTL